MFLKLTPDMYVKKFTDITPEAIFNLNAKAIFVDLDGTLVSKDTKFPTEDVFLWIETMKEASIEVVILSNNNELRVHNFSKELNIRYFHRALKPTIKGFTKAFATVRAKTLKSEIVMIGDQIYTDALAARRFGAKSIYVEPIDSNDLYVKFRRNITEKIFLSKLLKKVKNNEY